MARDQSSPGYVVQVISNTNDLRIKGKLDKKKLGRIVRQIRSDDVTSRITSLEFEHTEKGFNRLRLMVDNHDLYFSDHPAWVKGNLIRFVIGYPDQVLGPKYVVIDSVRGHQELEITGVQEAALANQVKNRLFKNTTRPEIVKKIVAEGGIPGVTKWKIDESGLSFEKPRGYQQAKQTNWQFLLRIAEKVGYEVFVEDDTLHFRPRDMGQRPIRKYQYYYGQGQLLEFNIEEYRVVDRAAEVDVRGRDPVSRKNISETGSDSKTSRTRLGSEANLTRKDSSIVGQSVSGAFALGEVFAGKRPTAGSKVVITPESSRDVVKMEADTHFKREEQQEIVATAVITGDPAIRPRSMVQIEGLGKTLSGLYYVTKHVHEFSSDSGYQGRLDLLKNAVRTLPVVAVSASSVLSTALQQVQQSLSPSLAIQNKKKVPKRGVDSRRLPIRRNNSGELFIEKRFSPGF